MQCGLLNIAGDSLALFGDESNGTRSGLVTRHVGLAMEIEYSTVQYTSCEMEELPFIVVAQISINSKILISGGFWAAGAGRHVQIMKRSTDFF
jgi:hypothetical protein